ncbi:MAG: aspartyl protease family protein [Gammaproteobacteria bacterium]|jgi:aspartyl protease family protein
MNGPRPLGAAMYIIASILLLVLLTSLFGDALERQRNPNASPTSLNPGEGPASTLLQRNRAGHYVFNGTVNGTTAEFLVDTGATAVAVPARLATSLGLQRGTPMQALTANGITTAYATRIDSLIIGEIEERDIAASIIPNFPGEQILLGMSFLKRLDFTQRGDTLILRQR